MKQKLAIIGGGACALMLASEIDTKKFEVHLFESNKTLGRKFLVAGDGGLNITHSESPHQFIHRYTPSAFLEKAFQHFSNAELIQWLKKAGIETYVGSSKRIFPKKGIKPIEVLNVFLDKIKTNHIHLHVEHRLIDVDLKGMATFMHRQSLVHFKYQHIVFCMGGASWPVTGSTGQWMSIFENKGITCSPFQSSNCAFKVDWPIEFIAKHHGKVLKNIKLTCHKNTNLGEVVITKFGIEGSGVYPLSPQIRAALQSQQTAHLFLDVKPDLNIRVIENRLMELKSKYHSDNIKSALNLSATAMALIKSSLSKQDFLNPKTLASAIKQLPLIITDLGPIENAISTVGGLDLNEVSTHFELKKWPNHYAIGEMLDYDAPTGGYLLQSCFSMSKYLADYLNHQHKKI